MTTPKRGSIQERMNAFQSSASSLSYDENKAETKTPGKLKSLYQEHTSSSNDGKENTPSSATRKVGSIASKRSSFQSAVTSSSEPPSSSPAQTLKKVGSIKGRSSFLQSTKSEDDEPRKPSSSSSVVSTSSSTTNSTTGKQIGTIANKRNSFQSAATSTSDSPSITPKTLNKVGSIKGRSSFLQSSAKDDDDDDTPPSSATKKVGSIASKRTSFQKSVASSESPSVTPKTLTKVGSIKGRSSFLQSSAQDDDDDETPSSSATKKVGSIASKRTSFQKSAVSSSESPSVTPKTLTKVGSIKGRSSFLQSSAKEDDDDETPSSSTTKKVGSIASKRTSFQKSAVSSSESPSVTPKTLTKVGSIKGRSSFLQSSAKEDDDDETPSSSTTKKVGSIASKRTSFQSTVSSSESPSVTPKTLTKVGSIKGRSSFLQSSAKEDNDDDETPASATKKVGSIASKRNSFQSSSASTSTESPLVTPKKVNKIGSIANKRTSFQSSAEKKENESISTEKPTYNVSGLKKVGSIKGNASFGSTTDDSSKTTKTPSFASPGLKKVGSINKGSSPFQSPTPAPAPSPAYSVSGLKKVGSLKGKGAFQSADSSSSSTGPTTPSMSVGSIAGKTNAFQKAASPQSTLRKTSTTTPSSSKLGSIAGKTNAFQAAATSSPALVTPNKFSAATPSTVGSIKSKTNAFTSPSPAKKFGTPMSTSSSKVGSIAGKSNAFQAASASASPSSKFGTTPSSVSKVGSIASKSNAFQSAATMATPSPSKGPRDVNKLNASAVSKIGNVLGKQHTTSGTPSPFGKKKVGNVAASSPFNNSSSDNDGTPVRGRQLNAKAAGDAQKKLAAAKKNAIAERRAKANSPPRCKTPPPKKKMISLLDQKGKKEDGQSHEEGALSKLHDKSKKDKVIGYMKRIEVAGGFPQTRRLSVRDNDLVAGMTHAIANDPSITEFVSEDDPRFEHVSKSLVLQFSEGLRGNFYVTNLSMTGIELGNGFLSGLATSIEVNFTLKTINLSNNSFTNDALIEFCLALRENCTITKVDLRKQHSPIFDNAMDQVFEALEHNHTVQDFHIDFKSQEDGSKRLQALVTRNQQNPPKRTNDEEDNNLLMFLSNEAERAEELYEQRMAEEQVLQVREDDWGYLFELSELFDRFRYDDEVVDEENGGVSSPGRGGGRSPPGRTKSSDSFVRSPPGRNKSSDSIGSMLGGFTSDGSFLTEEFISQYLVENPERQSLLFDFRNQFKMFKRFPTTDPARNVIVTKFVDALLDHPRMKDITGINMANSCCGNDFFITLADKCLGTGNTMLPKLNLINAETNYITESGVKAIASCIGDPDTFIYLQALKLDNQRSLLSSKGELALAKAMCVNRGIIRMSLRVRNLLERQQINKYIQRNVDFLRQARRHHAIETGTLEERKRNDMEQFFDKIASNDSSITVVEIVGNQQFISLTEEEKIKAGLSFANNTHVKSVQMSTLGLDCKFCIALGEALETNNTIEKLLLDSNAIGGDGMKALMSGLAKNSTVVELQVRHQSKTTGSADEELLAELLDPNTTITKLGVDLRSQLAKIKIDKKLSQNREIHRKQAHNGTTDKDRKRNDMEQFFDKIASNDSSITEVEIVGNQRFTSLTQPEKIKAGLSFANNTHVKTVQMTTLGLDCKFCIALGEALETNNTIEKLLLDSNAIGGDGMKALMSGLAKNSTVVELQVRHQSKTTGSADEELLAELLDPNTTITKLGIAVRSQLAKIKIDKKLSQNREIQRKKRVQASKS